EAATRERGAVAAARSDLLVSALRQLDARSLRLALQTRVCLINEDHALYRLNEFISRLCRRAVLVTDNHDHSCCVWRCTNARDRCISPALSPRHLGRCLVNRAVSFLAQGVMGEIKTRIDCTGFYPRACPAQVRCLCVGEVQPYRKRRDDSENHT